jgi:hypothetical protein
VIQQLSVDLGTARRRFNEKAVIPVGRQDMAVGSYGEPERIVDRPIGCHITTCKSRGMAFERVGDGRDPVVQGTPLLSFRY